jgi:hypothetical protein
MIKIRKSDWKLCIVFLVIFALLTNGASALAMNKMMKGDDHEDGCPSDENVKEEIVGLSPDGKDFLIKRVTKHPFDSKGSIKPQATSGSGCYKLMNGIKWLSPNITYVINPTNSGLDPINVTAAFSTSTGTWDSSTSWNLFGTYTVDNRGYGYDGYNTLLFGSLSDNRIIAQTTTWYYRFSRQIVEFDIVFNTYFGWDDATVDPAKMDLQNIATHELGHGIGLADLYNSCIEETMYGYSSYGETKKRDLNAGDIAGLQRLYGV